jgi:pimeloyl-ACP methyl ester carboxylesterase
MRIAARRPELIRSLILLETSADPEPPENVGRYRMLTAVTRAFGTRIIAGRVGPIMVGKSLLGDPARKADLRRFVGLMTRRSDIWRAVNGVIDRAGIFDEVGRIKAPTVVIVGDEDLATPLPKAQRIVAGIAGARLVQIPRAGHSSPVEEPAAVTAAIDQALTNR